MTEKQPQLVPTAGLPTYMFWQFPPLVSLLDGCSEGSDALRFFFKPRLVRGSRGGTIYTTSTYLYGKCMYVRIVANFHGSIGYGCQSCSLPAEHGKWYFSVPVRGWEFGLARHVRLPRPASARSFSPIRLNLVLPLSTTASIYLYRQLSSSDQSRVYQVMR